MSIFETVPRSQEQASTTVNTPQLGVRLSSLGMQLEMLRLARGLSKQQLARSAGTSRQQLWRVMTGKSELTSSLCVRLASVLDVDSRTLSTSSLVRSPGAASIPLPRGRSALDVAAYVATEDGVVRTLATLPPGPDGIALKRALLDAVAELARRCMGTAPDWMPQVEARVASGQL